MPAKVPLIERPDPNRKYLRREYRPPQKQMYASPKDTFRVRAINVVRLNPLIIVEVK